MALSPLADGCAWPIDLACLDDAWVADFDPDVRERAIALAGNTLRRLTAYRVGGCPITVRPCSQACYNMHSYMKSYVDGYPGGMSFIPMNWNGVWTNCACGSACGHSPFRLTLDAPVGGGVVVKVDGTTLVVNTDYWVDGCDIVRLGTVGWPTTQDLNKKDTAVGTFSVTYLNSYPVDNMGAYACAKLAYQYALACSGGDCQLPTTVTTIVRQGVTYELPGGSFPNGLTGILEVDAYIALWNPSHRKQGPKVWSPA